MAIWIFMYNVYFFLSCYANICFHGVDRRSNEDSVYNKDYFCCDCYEKIGTACVECDIGYTSSKGEPCEPCSGKRYGYRCADKCLLCTANQRCDHIHGCMNVSTTDSTQLSGSFNFEK
ncbi:uncharacterized protein LOC127716269 isoform X2 [Mytilus californianus]|uniref:uncharacterized protein LOC127716269 isoform X2 n=1 Tax=Mytilus californianus TaxID=6549 RepID=UPI0022453D21|nr:uncharacterized protein LOC127716269 isoform X2 [Mytilus californianus]